MTFGRRQRNLRAAPSKAAGAAARAFGPAAGTVRLSWSAAARAAAWPLSCPRPSPALEDLRRHPTRPRAQLAARRRRGPDARPAGDADRRRPARQAQAHVHAARGHRRLRGRGQRREDLGDRRQAPGEALPPPFRLSGGPEDPHAQRHARAPAGGGHPPRRARDAPQEPAGPQAAHEAQGLCRPGAPARGAEAATDGDQVLSADEKNEDREPEELEATEPEQPAAEEQPAEQAEAPAEEAAAPEPVAEAPAEEPSAAAAEREDEVEEVDQTRRVKP